MDNITEILNRVMPNFDEKEKDNLYKYAISLKMANKETLDLIEQKGIVIKKARELKVLTIDPKTITQALELATKMDFLEGYIQNPTRLCQMVTNIIKRMAKCEALSIPYKNEDGKFLDFIYYERKFNEKMKEFGELGDSVR